MGSVAVAVGLATLGVLHLDRVASARERVADERPSMPEPGAVSVFVAALDVHLDPLEGPVRATFEAFLAEGAVPFEGFGSTTRHMDLGGVTSRQWDVVVQPWIGDQRSSDPVHFDLFLDDLLPRLEPWAVAALDRRELRLVCTYRADDDSVRSAELVRRGQELAFDDVDLDGRLGAFFDIGGLGRPWPGAGESESTPRAVQGER
ncbi:hypothetical protein Pla163_12690 [Planctomycetes bacterium Pla163]|uniref:Uncharacterized protein n=1 Tax=Rohdeia mirabilis TaxID=2528008 RepID=A0A518CY67_9BACT|nr:hypothetical protein Pla163_12690 [Planctomycetes bacterium Pla163]